MPGRVTVQPLRGIICPYPGSPRRPFRRGTYNRTAPAGVMPSCRFYTPASLNILRLYAPCTSVAYKDRAIMHINRRRKRFDSLA